MQKPKEVEYMVSSAYGVPGIVVLWRRTQEEGVKIVCRIPRKDVPKLIKNLQEELDDPYC